jgi:hypothetical protein
MGQIKIYYLNVRIIYANAHRGYVNGKLNFESILWGFGELVQRRHNIDQ